MCPEQGLPDSKRPSQQGTSKRRWLLVSLEIAGALLLALVFSAWQARKLLPDDGRQAPDFHLVDLNGRQLTLADFRGKTTLVHFWATWCGVCRQEFAALNAVQKGLARDQALLTVVADGDDLTRLRRFVREENLSYPVLLGTREVLERYRVQAFPTNYYLDKAGRLRDATLGLSTRFSMQARLNYAE